MAFRTPVVRDVARRILDHSDANAAKVTCLPIRASGFAGMLSALDITPVGDTERDLGNLHNSMPFCQYLAISSQASLALEDDLRRLYIDRCRGMLVDDLPRITFLLEHPCQ